VTIKMKIAGELAQSVTCQLEQGQTIYTNSNKFRWKTTNVMMETRLSTPSGTDDSGAPAKKGGLLQQALSTATDVGKRVLSGQSLAFQWFRSEGGSGLVAFAGNLPGQMRVIELDGTTGWFTEKEAFICAEDSVKFGIALSKFRSGRRSGEGYILEHFTGSGTLLVSGGGTLIDLDPANYGGKIQVHAGALVAFAETIEYGVDYVGGLNMQTVMTAAFGGQGLSLISLSGSGPVILQSTLHYNLETEERNEDERRGMRQGGGLLDRL
jgi:uncharacterized protein (AIM24 family)